MDPTSEGCRLCLDPFAGNFATIDSPELKVQMAKVFCFSIDPIQGCCSGVCQSCSYTISEFYKYSEQVRQNQELLNGNVVNCDPPVDANITLGSVKVETVSDSECLITEEDACESIDDIPEEGIPTLDLKISFERVKDEDDSEYTEDVCVPIDEGLREEEDANLESKITLERVNIETFSDSGFPERTEDAYELYDEVSDEESSALDSKIALERMITEMYSDSEYPEEPKDAYEPEYDLAAQEIPTQDSNIKLETAEVEMLSDSQLLEATENVYQPPPGKRKLEDFESDETTKNSAQTVSKTDQKRIEQDELFNKHFRMICDLCGTSTATYTELESHYRTEHSRRYGYVVCCNLKLSRRYIIRNHIEFHANPDLFRCQLCGVKFRTKNALNSHLRVIHSNDDQGILSAVLR